jgi:DNA-binding MurR/RpiR family transcriptional regulator
MVTVDEPLPERIRRRYNSLSESQRKVARYCVSQAERAGTLTALRIAQELEVSESTVVRFAVKIGYRGFPDMQASIRAASKNSGRSEKGSHSTVRSRMSESLRNDLDALEQTVEQFDVDALAAAAEAIDGAKQVWICGFRTSFSLAQLAEFHIRHIYPGARLIDALGGTMVDDLELIRRGDAVLAFTFPVYDARTLRVIDDATKIGAASVVITDSALAPIPIDPLVHPFMVRHDGESFFNSNVSATAVLNALMVRLVELQTRRDPDFENALVERFHRTREHAL